MSSSKPFLGKLLVSDMDSTLITDRFEVPPRNIEAINRFIEKGGRFTLATGRAAASAAKYLDRVTINAPAILSNGGSIYDLSEHKILWNTPLPLSVKGMLHKILPRFPNLGIEIYSNEEIYIINANEWTKRHIINEGFKYFMTSIDDAPTDGQKILFADENANLLELSEYINTIEHSGCDFTFSSKNYFEVLPQGISKGYALKKLASILGIEQKNTIAIGDYYNDISLVKAAGIGATVQGSPKEIIDVADFVTGPCKNGAVADLIEFLEKSLEI
jgi:Cof subfamily protein (haloacid dehalogenase superfamily)